MRSVTKASASASDAIFPAWRRRARAMATGRLSLEHGRSSRCGANALRLARTWPYSSGRLNGLCSPTRRNIASSFGSAARCFANARSSSGVVGSSCSVSTSLDIERSSLQCEAVESRPALRFWESCGACWRLLLAVARFRPRRTRLQLLQHVLIDHPRHNRMDLHGALSRELPEIGEHRGCRLAVARDDVEQPHRLAARPILAGEAHGKDARLHLLGDLCVDRIRQLANWTLTAGTAGCAWYAGRQGRGGRWNTAKREIPRR